MNKIECDNKKPDSLRTLSFLASAVIKKPDDYKKWMLNIYYFEIGGKGYHGSTDGTRIHYVPSLGDKSTYEVAKHTKSNVVLVETPLSDYMKGKADSYVKVMPKKKNCIEMEIKLHYIYKLEGLNALICGLTGCATCFNINFLKDLTDHMRPSCCNIRIWAPKENPYKAWRFEYYSDFQCKDFVYGAVIMPLCKDVIEANAIECLYNTKKKECTDCVCDNGNKEGLSKAA